MNKPTIESLGTTEYAIHVFWQNNEEGVSEPAISIRTYNHGECGLVQIKQGDHEILINAETVDELCKVLKQHAKASKIKEEDQ